MRSLLLAAVTALAGLAGASALAGDKPLVVLELYTSQGCSNCPPADALVAELASREDVLPLALHVDYWDYIGWPDNFARPENTARQKAYARVAGHGSIFTPQIVIGGVDHVVGFKPMKVADLLQAHGARPEPVEVEVEWQGDTLKITCAPRDDAVLPAKMTVDLVRYQREATVNIRHGENAGETISYANIVLGWDRVGSWTGAGLFEVSAPAPGDGPLAVIVQEDGPGRVISALRVR